MRFATTLMTLVLCLSLLVVGSLPHAQQVAAAEQVRQLSMLAQRQKDLAKADAQLPPVPASSAQKLAAALEHVQLGLGAGGPAGEAALGSAAGEICPLGTDVVLDLEQGLSRMVDAMPELAERSAHVRPDIDRVATALDRLCRTLQDTSAPAAERSADVLAQVNALLAGSPPPVTGIRFEGPASRQPAPAILQELDGSTASPLNPAPPGPADLAETMEIQFTDDIRQLAADLQHDPERIVSYVHDTIHYEPYRGSLREDGVGWP